MRISCIPKLKSSGEKSIAHVFRRRAQNDTARTNETAKMHRGGFSFRTYIHTHTHTIGYLQFYTLIKRMETETTTAAIRGREPRDECNL